jgi:hypothetical protein
LTQSSTVGVEELDCPTTSAVALDYPLVFIFQVWLSMFQDVFKMTLMLVSTLANIKLLEFPVLPTQTPQIEA